jgi:hypothetical protein
MFADNLLSLVRNLHLAAFATNGHVGRGFLGYNGRLLVLKRSKRDVLDCQVTHLLETTIALENGSESIFVDIGWKILQEEDLVGAHVFVGNGGDTRLKGAWLLGGGGVDGSLSVLFGALHICLACQYAINVL